MGEERPSGNYKAAVERYTEENHIPQGLVTEVAVMHDDWCDLLKGAGPCNCEPVIKHLKTHGDAPEGPPNKRRPKEPVLWARLQRTRRRPA